MKTFRFLEKASVLGVSLLALVAVSFVGCSGKGLKGLVPAEGVVTFNGEAVEGATVVFSPKQIGGENSGSATATTDKNGKFKMTTRSFAGIFPGDYRVTITKDRVEGGPTLEQAQLSPDEYKKIEADIPPQVTIRELPAIYADMNASGLDTTVPAGGVKDLNFALEGEADLTPIESSAGGRGGAPGL